MLSEKALLPAPKLPRLALWKSRATLFLHLRNSLPWFGGTVEGTRDPGGKETEQHNQIASAIIEAPGSVPSVQRNMKS